MNKSIASLVVALTCFSATVADAADSSGPAIESVLNDTEIAHLVFMREEEKLARDSYITLGEVWGLRTFENISKSEQKHMDALLDLLNTYGLEDPIVSDAVGAFTNDTLAQMYVDLVANGEESLLDALYVGALIEEVDIRDIRDAIAETTQADINVVYENLIAGSENHLRAFAGQIENRGEEYIAQVLDQSEVDAILGKPVGDEFGFNAGLNDAWYDPETNGQGFFVTVFPDFELVSLAWFTYDTERPQDGIEANLGEPGHRWLTALGSYSGNQAQLDITITSGGIFDSGYPETTEAADGTILLQFDDCNSGTVAYDIPSINRVGLVAIERVATDNVALCEALIATVD